MKRVLRVMIDIFHPEGIDWMNFALSKNNPYTFHHILEKSKGGDKSVDNGAILTRKAHSFLHMLELNCPEAYQDLQNVFMKINESKSPVSQEIIEEIDDIIYDLLTGEKYKLPSEIDVESYCNHYYLGKRKLKKCLK